MNLRKIISMTLFTSLLLLLLTSVILYIVPHGRVAYWSGWRFWGLSKTQWSDLHINLGILFLAASVFHLFYNWKLIVAYLSNKAKELKIITPAFNVSLLLCLVVSVGTLLNIPPMSMVLDFSESIKDAASEKYGEPPYGHAELSSLKLLTRKTGLDLNKAKALLVSQGVQGVTDEITLEKLARINQTTPKMLYEIMTAASKGENRSSKSFPDTPPAGFGRKTLTEICDTYGLDRQVILQRLQEKGLAVSPDNSLKEIAEENNTDPHALFELLYDVVQQ